MKSVRHTVRLQGFALSFGSRSQGTCSRISSQHHPFSSASQGVLEQIACLRVSLQMANTLAHAEERAPKPLSCLFLQLQHGRLKVSTTPSPTQNQPEVGRRTSSMGDSFRSVLTFPHFSDQLVSTPFLNRSTRHSSPLELNPLASYRESVSMALATRL